MHIKQPSSQLDYMLSETRGQLVNFSQMADTKANILLSISSVLATIAITKVTDSYWKLPIIVMVVFLLGAIVCALLAVIPNMQLLHRFPKSTRDPDFNALFFGDYAHVPYEEYRAFMEEVMNDPSRSYEMQVHEIYRAGKYLQSTKYNFIQVGYILFFIGVFTSIVISLIELL